MATREEIVEALHTVDAPELGIDIVEVRLFDDGPDQRPVTIGDPDPCISMGSPGGQMIQDNIHEAASAVEGGEEVEVELTSTRRDAGEDVRNAK